MKNHNYTAELLSGADWNRRELCSMKQCLEHGSVIEQRTENGRELCSVQRQCLEHCSAVEKKPEN